jgi:deoxyribodipyrimidine photo-lyase
MKRPLNIVWLKRDLRLRDHRPLLEAVEASEDFLVIYIFEPIVENNYDFDIRHWQFVYQSLLKLRLKIPVSLFYGPAQDVFLRLMNEFEVKNIFSHQETGVMVTFKRDLELKSFFKSHQILWREFQHNAVIRGLKNRNTWDAAWIKTMSTPIQEIFLDEKKIIEVESSLPKALVDKIGVNSFDEAGYDEAHSRLNLFLEEKVENYWKNISCPDKSRYHCSRLSAHLSWGNISIREIYQACRESRSRVNNKVSLDQFMARLKWHCHFIQKLEMQPDIEWKNLNPAFDHLRQKENKEFLKAWKKGETGYPLIDAAMRCVKETGYLNFRLRSTVVSFLTHLLWQPWQAGARYLARQFLDYEPGIHFSQFQMQAGTTGINTIRIYNPIKQSLEKDKEAVFIKKWVPELRHLPVEFIHRPWEMTEMDQMLHQFSLGRDYPRPIVQFEEAYKKAQENLWREKKSTDARKHSQKILSTHGRKKAVRK